MTLIACAAGAAIACQWLVPLDAVDTPPTADAAADNRARGPANACEDPSTISRPATGGSKESIIDLAISLVAFNPSELDAGADIDLCPTAGFDLDHRRTCYDDAGNTKEDECPGPDKTACAWGPTCTRKDNVAYCDGTQGEDIAVGPLLTAGIKSVPRELKGALDFARVFRKGEGNVLIRIVGYNEEADDPSVAVSLYRSAGLTRDSALIADGGVDAAVEIWDGRSLREWTLDPITLSPNRDTPAFPPVQGFVRNHVLVVTAARTVLPGLVEVSLDDVVLMGELRPTSEGSWALVRGRLGGRISSSDLMRALLVIPLRLGNGELKGLCGEEGGPDLIKRFVCPYRDLGVDGGPCTDISFGVAFTAVPAIFGPRRSTGLVDASCPRVVECE